MNSILVYTLSFTVTGLMITLLVVEPLRRNAARWFFELRHRPWFLPAIILVLYATVTVFAGPWEYLQP